MSKKYPNLEHYIHVDTIESCLLKYFGIEMKIDLPTYRTKDTLLLNLVIKKDVKKLVDKNIFKQLLYHTGFYQLDINGIEKQEKPRMFFCDFNDCDQYYK